MSKLTRLSLLLIATILLSGCSPLKAKNSGLQVITSDVASSIFLDGQYLEKTPYIGKNFKPGVYTLRIQPDDASLVPYETTIRLTKGLLSVVTWKPGKRPESSGGVIYEMEKLSNKNQTELSIISLPDNAIVSIDSGPKQFTPILIDSIDPGQHEFEITIPSYETQKHTINVIAGHRMNVTVKLAKTLEVANDDKVLGQTENASTATDSATVIVASSSAVASKSATPLRKALDQPLSGPMVSITSTNFFVDGQEVLRVRQEASPSASEIGYATVGQQYPYLNETFGGWYKIQLDDKIGWVSGQFSKLENKE